MMTESLDVELSKAGFDPALAIHKLYDQEQVPIPSLSLCSFI